MKYREFEQGYLKYYVENNFQEAVVFMEKAKDVLSEDDYKDYFIHILRDKAILYFLNKDYTKVLDTLETLIDKGYSISENIFNMIQLDDDIRYLQLKKQNEALVKKAKEEATLQYQVCLPKNYNEDKNYPVFFNVHGDGMDGNIQDQMRNWPPDALLEQGYIVVYPQSSQTYCTNGHGWMKDKELARKEIKICFDEVCEKYSIDKDQVILAGFSGGADAVIDFSMQQVFPVKGFISLCPTKFIKSFTNEQMIAAKNKGMKGCILEGEKDLVVEVKELVDELNELGFKCRYIVNKNVGHWVPDDLTDKVNDIIQFFNK